MAPERHRGADLAALQGRRGGQPTVVKMALADKISGMTAALSIVSALHAARNRGVGQNIRIPMVEAMMLLTLADHYLRQKVYEIR